MDADTNHISNTVIDGSQATNPELASTVLFNSGEDTTSVIKGFTITGGSGFYISQYNVKNGGGIALINSGAKIEHNIITQNSVEHSYAAGGSGIGAFSDSSGKWLVARNNVISYNVALCSGYSAFGAGIASVINSIIQFNTIEYNSCTNATGYVDSGGIEIEHFGSPDPPSALISHNIIRHNSIQGLDAYGAGVCVNGADEVQLLNNDISYNTMNVGQYGYGGGMFSVQCNRMTITGNQFIGNDCAGYRTFGAGCNIEEPGNSLNIENNTFTNNACNANNRSTGSAMRVIHPCNGTKITQNNFSHNLATGSEMSYACVFLWDAMDNEVSIDCNIFYMNRAMYAGGFYARNSNNLRVTNNLFLRNTATGNGGAIVLYEHNTKGNPDLPEDTSGEPLGLDNKLMHSYYANNSFLYNHAYGSGGAIMTDVDINYPIYFNSIFYGNTAGSLGTDIRNIGNLPIVVSYSDFRPENISGPWTGTDNIWCDPQTQPDSLHLQPGSCCIDAGTDSLLVEGTWYLSPAWDIDGQLRPCPGTAPDIGADEYHIIILAGDANCDGLVNVLDVVAIVNYVIGLNPQPFCFENADIDGNGLINVLDVTATINIIIGGKAAPFPGLKSGSAHIFLNPDNISLLSDGTLAGLQFEMYNVKPGELELALPGFEFASAMQGNKLTGLIYSLNNTPIPAGLITLFEPTPPGVKWGQALAGNLNAEAVPVILHQQKEKIADGIAVLNIYPNPLRTHTTLEYQLEAPGFVHLAIYNQMGKQVAVPVDEHKPAGVHKVSWNAAGLRAGIYYCRLQTGNQIYSEKMILIK
jgi:hypothetical protein